MESEYERIKVNREGEEIFAEKPLSESDRQKHLKEAQARDFEIAKALRTKGNSDEIAQLMREPLNSVKEDNIVPFKTDKTKRGDDEQSLEA